MKHTAMRPAEINTSKAPHNNNQMKLVRMMTMNNSPDKRNINSNGTANPSLKKAMAAGGGGAAGIVGSPSITAAEGGYSPGIYNTAQKNNTNVINMIGDSNSNNFTAANLPVATNSN